MNRFLAFTKVVAAILVVLTAVIALYAFTYSLVERNYQRSMLHSTEIPGTPLDAVRVGAPSFADGDICYKVMDRRTECTWFMVQMRGVDGNLHWVVFEEENHVG